MTSFVLGALAQTREIILGSRRLSKVALRSGFILIGSGCCIIDKCNIVTSPVFVAFAQIRETTLGSGRVGKIALLLNV